MTRGRLRESARHGARALALERSLGNPLPAWEALDSAFVNIVAGRARLVLAARRTDRLEALAAELRQAHGTESHLVALDVRDAGVVSLVLRPIPAGVKGPSASAISVKMRTICGETSLRRAW